MKVGDHARDREIAAKRLQAKLQVLFEVLKCRDAINLLVAPFNTGAHAAQLCVENPFKIAQVTCTFRKGEFDKGSRL